MGSLSDRLKRRRRKLRQEREDIPSSLSGGYYGASQTAWARIEQLLSATEPESELDFRSIVLDHQATIRIEQLLSAAEQSQPVRRKPKQLPNLVIGPKKLGNTFYLAGALVKGLITEDELALLQKSKASVDKIQLLIDDRIPSGPDAFVLPAQGQTRKSGSHRS